MSYPLVKVDLKQFKKNMYFILGKILEKIIPVDYNTELESFISSYENIVSKIIPNATTDYLKLRIHIVQFKPALLTILKPGPEFDKICEWILPSFDAIVGSAKRQATGEQKDLERIPITPRSINEPNIIYFCSICKEEFPIPSDIKEEILNSSEKISLPKHHNIEMQIKIKESPLKKEPPKLNKINELDFSTEFLMGHLSTEDSNPEYLKVLSVGIDIGTTTSHLIFSNLTLKRETSFFNMTNRFALVNREIIYESDIIITPLINQTTIDIESISSFIEEEYSKAGIQKENVDTGAVIVTGETAKKKNAAEIAQRVSSETGKFVSATAGPNFESVLGIMGSGILEQTKKERSTIINIDIGGGTSNLALASNGIVLSTSCINVGGRLLGINENHEIWRMDKPTVEVFKILGLEYNIGDIIKYNDLNRLITAYTDALIEVMQSPAKSDIAKLLMMTEDLEFSTPIDFYSFSGGVSEFIYSNGNNEINDIYYQDIGILLAKSIKKAIENINLKLTEPENKIRATVIGAGAFSLSVSGSTCYVDKKINLPINNIPVIPVNLSKEFFSLENTSKTIKKAIANYDLVDGEDVFGLYFDDPIYHSDRYLVDFSKGIEIGLENSIKNKQKVILLFKSDMAKMLSIALRKETKLLENLIILDELTFEPGDWIDIGTPLSTGDAYPVTVKSLVFKSN